MSGKAGGIFEISPPFSTVKVSGLKKNEKRKKSEIPAIDKSIKKSKDSRCTVDKLLGIDKPKTKHTGAESRNNLEAQRTFQLIIKQNHSILDFFKKQQEIEEIKTDIIKYGELYVSEDEFDSEDEELKPGDFTENGTQINEE